MSSTYRSTKRDAAVADEFLAAHGSCRTCQAQAPMTDLCDLGGTCRVCYRRYCAEANPSWWPNRPLTPDERRALIRKAQAGLRKIGQGNGDPRGWARALKAREEAGERLSSVQQQAWRAALPGEAQ